MTNIPSISTSTSTSTSTALQPTVVSFPATNNSEAKTMSDDIFPVEERIASTESKKRKKRKWDQPAESLVSCGVVLPGMLPITTVGFPGVSLPGALSASGVPSISSMAVGYVSIQASVVQQQAAAMVQKLNQPKIQEELIIAREIVINDADPGMRYKLTKRHTQEEIQKCTGAVVITRGKYRPPNAVPDGEKPLYLHISAGAHLKETAERILAVDRAAAMVEDMLKQVPQLLSTCVYLGFDADLSLNIAARIRGPNDQYINHIINETGATVVLRGRGSGYLGNTQGEEGQQPLHLMLSSNNQKSLEDAKLLAENLLDTISRECGASRVSSCKVYSAVPPPQQLLVGVQSSGAEVHSNLSSSASTSCSASTSVPGVPVPVAVSPVVPAGFSYGQVVQPGHAQTNGFPYSQPSSASCTSYSAYAGIYPQATPLQQVTLALRQSGPVSSTAAPATSAIRVMPKSSTESEKRHPLKRKFQESPAALKGVAVSDQELDLQDSRKCLSSMEKKNINDTTLPPPSLKSLMPPPPPRRSSCSAPSPDSRKMPPAPHPPKSLYPAPSPPKFDSSVSVGTVNDRDNISNRSSVPTVPDTLVKLMEYGDDDDDDDDAEENQNGSCESGINREASSKPFWAV